MSRVQAFRVLVGGEVQIRASGYGVYIQDQAMSRVLNRLTIYASLPITQSKVFLALLAACPDTPGRVLWFRV